MTIEISFTGMTVDISIVGMTIDISFTGMTIDINFTGMTLDTPSPSKYPNPSSSRSFIEDLFLLFEVLPTDSGPQALPE
ncbi:hypothetical protein [Shewanella gaetbuli]|uniref:Uncharacterized protein n=1 Tax=Shewanella gaetbuli TaxID=220752 RepID=A0A9X1ZHP5_9GAMM|nr:hypothetical protein [Shewanella gaetbuli]MCL1141207.1 hypothetical protein [Shewanella gaetbuli]